MKQLSFFDSDTEQDAARPPAPTYDIPAMRAKLLSWGEQHNYPALSFPLGTARVGLIWDGQKNWLHNTQLENHNYNLLYPAQWLAMAIEHIKNRSN
jgi:hypothetical protein